MKKSVTNSIINMIPGFAVSFPECTVTKDLIIRHNTKPGEERTMARLIW